MRSSTLVPHGVHENNPRPALLRNAVRLVHCLQKERGASCAATVSAETFGKSMKSARHSTTVALKLWSRDNNNSDISIESTLSKARRQIDMILSEEREDMSEAGAYHKILVLFNTIIGTVMHSFLLQHEAKSSTVNNKLETNFNRPKQNHRRVHSDISSVFSKPGIVGFPNNKNNDVDDFASFKREVSFKPAAFLHDKTGSLLKLLDCFVRLKESTGIERALLSSIFAMGKISHLMLNDLILEAENQSKLIKELKSLRDVDQPLLDVIREGVVLPEPMERLQSYILREFDLKGFQEELSTEDVWNLITVHMDKLHSLELHVIEEIECSLAEGGVFFDRKENIQSIDPNIALSDIFESSSNLSEKLVQMSPEEIKLKLITHLARSDITPSPPVVVVSGAESPMSSSSELPLPLQDSPGAPSEWDIDLYEIKFEKRIGRGTAGTTYLAKWSGQKVAVKVAAITKMGLDGWQTEVESLRKLHHPNVIRLLGCVYNETPLTYCLVLEYCNGGDLASALTKPTSSNFFKKVTTDMANGMRYLHKKGIIHRDLKPANVLIDGDVSTQAFSAKITDFGVAVDMGKSDLTSETGTYRWMAPEIVRHEHYSEKADVYSFAITLWQLLTRENPFAPYSSIEAAGKVAIERVRPPFPVGIPAPVMNLIKECWAEEPSSRLSFTEICKKLGEFNLTDPKDVRWLQASLGHPVYDDDEPVSPTLNLPNLQKPSIKIENKPGRGIRKLFSKKKVSL